MLASLGVCTRWASGCFAFVRSDHRTHTIYPHGLNGSGTSLNHPVSSQSKTWLTQITSRLRQLCQVCPVQAPLRRVR
jgi:hypothetical protein